MGCQLNSEVIEDNMEPIKKPTMHNVTQMHNWLTPPWKRLRQSWEMEYMQLLHMDVSP